MPADLKFGIAITASEPPVEFIKTVQLAEKLGFDSVWIPEFRLFHDVYVSLALAALNTTRVRLGCAVTNPYARHPGMTAVGIATVDSLSNGRAVLGLGAGGVLLNLLQIEQRRPVDACRNVIDSIRGYFGYRSDQLVEDPLDVRLDFPVRADLPIFLAATGQKMLKLAGEMADGVIVNVGVNKKCIDIALAAVAKGAWSARRPREGLEMLCWLQGCAVSSNREVAINQVKSTAALTLAHAPGWMLEAMEIDQDLARKIQKIYYAEGANAAAELVTDEMVEKYNVAGSPQQVAVKIERLRAKGFDEVIFLPAESGSDIRSQMKSLAKNVIWEIKGSQ